MDNKSESPASASARGTETAPSATNQRIRRLNPEAIAQIHSSKHITSLQGVVLSLLENSLDAGASKVDITVDWRRGSCTVEDNGSGIPIIEFGQHGSLGKMYCTSKRIESSTGSLNSQHTHGSTGTFLAQLSAMSLLSIESSHLSSKHSGKLTLHHRVAIVRQTVSVELSDFARTYRRCGTTITVRDLFGNMPVRVKQRALRTESGGHNEQTWHELKVGVVGLLLAWPQSCAIKLRDLNCTNRVVHVSGQHPNTSSSLTEKSLHQLAGKIARYDLRDALPVLFQSGLALPESRGRWVPLSATTSTIRLNGMISLDPAPTKQCQFIALGVNPCGDESGHHELYSTVNKIFSSSSFGLADEKQVSSRRTDMDGIFKTKSQRSLDRHAMFYLQFDFKSVLFCTNSSADHLNDASLKALVEVLEAAITAWLQSNHFQPQKQKRRRNQAQSGPSPSRPMVKPEFAALTASRNDTDHHTKRSKIIDLTEETDQGRHFDGKDLEIGLLDSHSESRIKSGRLRHSADMDRTLSRGSMHTSRVDSPRSGSMLPVLTVRSVLHSPAVHVGEYNPKRTCSSTVENASDIVKGAAEAIPSQDFGSTEDEQLLTAAQPVFNANDNVVSWTDAATKQTFRVNSRTGVVLPMPSARPSCSLYADSVRHRAAIDTGLSSAGKSITLARRTAPSRGGLLSTPAATNQKWLPGFLKDWNNPVFTKRQEEPIPVASLDGPGLIENLRENQRCCSQNDKFDRAFSANGDALSAGIKLSKEALQSAEVINQVDKKFILLRVPHDSEGNGKGLVLVDQHAASERVILESLFKDLCTTTSTSSDGFMHKINTTLLAHDNSTAKRLIFEIPGREQELFTRYQFHFASWGILFELHEMVLSTDDTRIKSPSHRLTITHLPTPIAERCANFPTLAIDLLRTEIWSLADKSKNPAPPISAPFLTSIEDLPPWIAIPSIMPTKFLEMLQSRACRSAVMFNDVLTKEECEELVRNLGKCVFPFVCAHGRVGIVPVLQLTGENRELGGGGKGNGVDVEVLRSFMAIQKEE